MEISPSTRSRPRSCGASSGFSRFDEVTEAISAKEAQSERLALFIKCIKEQSAPVAEFDSQLWASMVECVTVGKGMTVVFRDGTEVRI